MRTRILVGLTIVVTVAGLATAASAATANDFKAVYAKAEAASKQAAAMKTQWVATVKALKAAQTAAAAGNYGAAVKDAQHAEALANASIAQSKQQAATWRRAVIR